MYLNSYKQLIFTVVIFLFSSCATVNFDYPKTESTAFTDTDDTYYARQFTDEVNQRPKDQSGFYLLPNGIDALSARLLMADRAERSIDAQYYEIKNDNVARAFIATLLRAADRGVRVRLLVDDFNTLGYDEIMAGLDSHPNFEIRIFNPFSNRKFRKLDALKDFSRLNRRMHNKSFTVDNQITIFGGRNIADEYFGAREDATFFDLDVVSIGPIVKDISKMFDKYWNHERAAPIPAFANQPKDPDAELIRIQKGLDNWREEILKTKYAEIVKKSYLEFVENGKEFVWAPYQLIYDSPDKAFKSKAKNVQLITTPIRKSLLAARREIIIVTPYFVPLKSGIDALSKVHESGVDITILTNSRAANNQALVHAGYAPARIPLLKNGIKIYEIRPTAEIIEYETVDFSSAKATLHTKAYIVDRNEIFIGSFNFDPRSANINTELGAIIKSPELANLMVAEVDRALKTKAFELFINENNKLNWRIFKDGDEVILSKEPYTSWHHRWISRFLQLLPIKRHL